jgi:hypothetical protein
MAGGSRKVPLLSARVKLRYAFGSHAARNRYEEPSHVRD